MYGIELGYPITIQQTISGTGTFDGTEQGRAKCTIPAVGGGANDIVYLSAKNYGATSNSYQISFIDAGAGVAVSGTTVSVAGLNINIRLRRSTGAILATAAEVAAAINSFSWNGLPIVASYSGNGTGVVSAASSVALNNTASGVTPTSIKDRVFKWAPTANTNGGFFYFENDEPVVIRFIGASFTVPTGIQTVSFWRTNLDSNLSPISGDRVRVFYYDGLTSSANDIVVNDPRIIIQPYQALQVTLSTAMVGTVQVDVQKMTAVPTL